MDWDKIATLLDIVNGCRNEPRLRAIRDAAMVEMAELLRQANPVPTVAVSPTVGEARVVSSALERRA